MTDEEIYKICRYAAIDTRLRDHCSTALQNAFCTNFGKAADELNDAVVRAMALSITNILKSLPNK